MASAPRPARNEPETETKGAFRCSNCGAIFDTQEELHEHQELNNHHSEDGPGNLDRNSGNSKSEEFDQLDGSRYPERSKQ